MTMRTVDFLRQLQELDSRIDASRALIPQLSAQVGDRHVLEHREAEIASVQRELQGLETEQVDLELAAEERRAKIASDEGKLYGGRVTSPKELSSLSEEVAQDKRQLNAIEDHLLDVLEHVESAKTRLASLEEALTRESSIWSVGQETARKRLAETESSLQGAEAQRATLLATLAPAVQSTYQTLRRQKGGVAVAPVHQRTCQACRVGLTPAQEQRARIGTDLVTCNSCGRILYVPLA
jgi:predicted  nucleic acid-binding Zn-ribbon protein